MAVAAEHGDDRVLERFGYHQQFERTLHSFASFAVAFSFISITTGIFTTYGFLLNSSGPRGIWTWAIVIAGQTAVALVYGALAAKIPLSGYSYQWASRLANPQVGWWLGWMSFAFLAIVTVSVDYGLVQVAFQPLIGETYTTTSAALETFAVLGLQVGLIVWSTRWTTRINSVAVATEVVGILGISIALFAAAIFGSSGHWHNLTSTGLVPSAHWYKWLGPFMLATLLGAYTIVGFEAACNLSEETESPRRVAPRAMWRSVVYSGVIGLTFLIAITVAMSDIKATSASLTPVADIVKGPLGSGFGKVFLVFVCISIFACGLVIMVTNSRLTWSMARDRRLPGHQLLARVPGATRTPAFTALLVAVVSGGILAVVGFKHNTTALFTLFTASTIMPAILYGLTLLLYVFTAHRVKTERGYFQLGRWEWPVLVTAAVWVVYELIVLIGPKAFRNAQYYALGAFASGIVVFALIWLLEPEAMRRKPGLEGAEPVDLPETPAPAGGGI